MQNQLISILKKHEKYINSFYDSINIVHDDLLLKKEGTKICYAIDFSELYYFLHPFTDDNIKKVVEILPSEDSNEALIREQITLNFIFTHFEEDKILLPPYQVELNDHINILKFLFSDYSNFRRVKFEDALRKGLYSQKSYPIIKAIIEKIKNNNKLERIELNKVVEYIKYNFKPLYLLLTLSSEGVNKSLETLRFLFNEKKLFQYNEYFTEINAEIDFEHIKEKSAYWYTLLKEDKIPQKDYARFIDSLACSYLDKINEIYQNQNKVILFISRSKRMKKVLYETPIKNFKMNNYNKSIIRDLDYFMIYLRHYRSDVEDMESELLKTKSNVIKLKTILEELLYHSSKFEKSFEVQANETLSDLNKIINSRENLSIALSKKGFLIENELPSFFSHVNNNDKIVKTLYDFMISNDSVHNLLIYADAELVKEIVKKISDLNLLTFNKNDYSKIRELVMSNLGTRTKLVLQALDSELPTEMNFTNQKVLELAQFLSHDVKIKSENNNWKEFVYKLINEPIDEPEMNLLRSYTFALLEDWKSAYDEIKMGLDNNRLQDTTKIELLYLLMIYSRCSNKIIEGIDAFVTVNNILSDDPRLLREFSVLIWQTLHQKTELAYYHVKSKTNIEPSLKEAIALAQKALYLTSNKQQYLKAQIYNTLSYFYLELANTNIHNNLIDEANKNLEISKINIDKIGKTISQKDFIARFYDTLGLCNLVDAKIKFQNSDEEFAKKLVKKSLHNFRIAIKFKNLSQYEIDYINEHVVEAKNLFNIINNKK